MTLTDHDLSELVAALKAGEVTDTIRASLAWILQQLIIASQGPESLLKKAVGSDWKGKASPIAYGAAIPLAFWQGWLSLSLYVLMALVWLVPDKRIERVLAHDSKA